MRIKCFLAIFLIITNVIAFSSTSLANNILAGERSDTALSTDDEAIRITQTGSVWKQATAWVWFKQRAFHRALTRELRNLRGKDGVGWALVLMSFLYGVFHAAGPGHGKVILTTYLLTHKSRLHRGVAMGATAALLQGVTALLLVFGLLGLADWLPRQTENAAVWATRMSFTLLAFVGFYLLTRAAIAFVHAIRQWRHTPDHVNHKHGDGCGCRHLPNTAEIDTVISRRAAVGVVLAIGLRPCSGAVLVLILASVMDIIWHGALAVFAMSFGTALTIVLLAIVATKARSWASAVVANWSPLWSPLWSLAAGGVAAFGGALLLFMGLWLLTASFALRSPLGF